MSATVSGIGTPGAAKGLGWNNSDAASLDGMCYR